MSLVGTADNFSSRKPNYTEAPRAPTHVMLTLNSRIRSATMRKPSLTTTDRHRAVHRVAKALVESAVERHELHEEHCREVVRGINPE